MKERYARWNKLAIKGLWWLVILGMLAALPVAYERHQTEQQSGRKVDVVFDYRDLLEISDTQPDPRGFIEQQLKLLQQHGVRSLAVYEATLNELKLSRRIEVFSSHDASALTQTPISPNENFTYILFTDKESEQRVREMVEAGFAQLNVQLRPWSYKNQPGMIIQMAMDEALMQTLDPDFITMQKLKDQGFSLVARLSNRRTFQTNRVDKLLGDLQGLGVKWVIVDGDSVPGFVSAEDTLYLDKMGEMLREHHIGLAAIEMQKTPQKGFNGLAKRIHHQVVRLHSFTESDSTKLTESLTQEELNGRIQGMADRLVLAVKDRNIRMLFLNARAVKSAEKGKIVNPLEAMYAALDGPEGALPRIEKAGYTFGTAQSFQLVHSGWQTAAKLLLWAGAVALIALTLSYFAAQLALAAFLLGMLGSAGLFVLSSSLFSQALALGAGTCAASLAIMFALQAARRRREKQASTGSLVGFAVLLLIRSSLISAIGILFIVGLLNQITYTLVLEQFRGVSVLHLAPIVIAGLYWLLFAEPITHKERLVRVRGLLSKHISVLWVITVAIVAAVGFYYLSRTGNEGTTTGVERYFRSFLENTLGVRPRIKEFMLAHPIFILGAYLSYKYRNATILILLGVIGQASIVDTFAHLHTPLVISSIRVVYGLAFGILIGLGLILVWEIVIRSWRRWVPRINAS
ncbi:hypothetical protein SAMN02799630_05236 [Paenibacillus sp. UNCCL117]|uniref:DUF5693 family protein n=1 Tax=unclassified Paenibacillus TaxID=185978 RepID=UPI000887277E|nr:MULTISPECIES: DUF5693 family protein [unclassified Paenibacillus]SDE34732.1 hypothetical protein SAMN04488602_12582 [Paenibacillus sp. cl123]SFW64338.1 hypothetical protein SAMN02799630_05236 [Paenibacillus sp. UNCCL117]